MIELVFKRLKETWLEKKKMLFISIFSFSHIAFKNLVFQGFKLFGLCGQRLICYKWGSRGKFGGGGGGLRNTAGKGVDAGYHHFLHFPTMFSKGFFLKIVKSEICGKGLNIIYRYLYESICDNESLYK